MKKMLILMAVAMVIAFIPATSSAATVLTTSTPEYLGKVDPGSPANPANEVVYVNTLLGLSANSSTTISNHTYTTSSNDCAGCPAAVLGNSDNIDTNGPVLNLDITNWTYVLAKYADVSYVWNVANLTTVDIPANLNNGQGNGLSHYILFNPTTPTGGVPDGGTTAGLLGLAMLGIGYVRRRMF